MSPARRFALTLSRILFRALLIAAISLGALYLSFGNSLQIKQSVVDANAYNLFIPAVLQSNDSKGGMSQFDDPKVIAIFQSAFTPELLRSTTETFIDSWYSWLRGDTPKPQFAFDFSQQRQDLAEQLSIYGIDRVSGLPVCTAFEPVVSLDPFTASCQPAGLNYRSEQLSLRDQLLGSSDFLPKFTYTDADLPKTRSNQPIAEKFAYAPLLFQLTPTLLAAMAAFLVLLASVSVLLRPVRRNGWRELGKNLLGSGLFLAVSAVVFGILVPQITRSFQSQFIGSGIDRILGEVVRYLTIAFETSFIYICLQVAAVGGGILLVVRFKKPGSRYAGLEHVTGVVNSVRPTLDTLTAKRAIGAPVVTSERQRKPHARAKKRRSKKPRITKEIV